MPSSILNSDDGVISGTAGLKNSGGDDAVLLIQTKGVTAQTVDAGQRTMFPTTIGVGGATPSTSGSGISFPATQSASTNANTLDDYEEGTWTPTVAGNTTPGTYTLSNTIAYYTKIGNLVTCFASFDFSAASGGTGQISIANLPFNYITGSAINTSPRISDVDTGQPNAINIVMTQASGGSNNDLTMAANLNNATRTLIDASGVSVSSRIGFTISYTIS